MMISLITVLLWVQKECGAKDEFWQLKSVLQSKYHMTDEQSDGAIIEVANHLFGWEIYGKWNKYQPNEPYDNNTFIVGTPPPPPPPHPYFLVERVGGGGGVKGFWKFLKEWGIGDFRKLGGDKTTMGGEFHRGWGGWGVGGGLDFFNQKINK